MLVLLAGCWQPKPVAQTSPVVAATSGDSASTGMAKGVDEQIGEVSPAAPQDVTTADDKAAPDEPDARESPRRQLPRERFLLLVPGGPLVVDVACTIDGLPLGDSLEQLITDMLTLADANHDGRTTWDELTLNPQFMRGVYGNEPIDTPEKRRQMIQQYDINRDRLVNHDEVTRFLSKNSGGGRAFRVQAETETGDLSRRESLVRRLLDANEDGVLDTAEMLAAAERLRSRDADDDEMIYLADLRPATNVAPEDRPRRRVSGPDAAAQLGAKTNLATVLLTLQEAYALGGRLDAHSFPQRPRLFAQLDDDHNGHLSAIELGALHHIEADLSLEAHFGHAAESAAEMPRLVSRRPAFAFGDGDDEVSLDAHSRQISFALPEMHVQFLIQDTVSGEDTSAQAAALLAQYDANKDGYLEKSELPEALAGMVADFDALDADGDGKIYPAEIGNLLRRQRAAAVNAVRAHVRQPEDALFAVLDTNHDGRLDWREVNSAPDRIQSLDRNHDGRVDIDEIPSHLIVEFVRGESTNNMNTPRIPPPSPLADKEVPAWFVRMDANGDGAISSREFLGDADQFRRLDANADGFLEWNEVAKSLSNAASESR